VHGHTTSQEHVSKYVPSICQAMAPPSPSSDAVGAILLAGDEHGQAPGPALGADHRLRLRRGDASDILLSSAAWPTSGAPVMPRTDHGGLEVRIVIDFLSTVREEAVR